MEDLKAYIETGILERYATGDLGQEEMHKVEELVKQHPEIKAELYEIENALEGYADAYSLKPSEHLRERILTSMVGSNANQETPIDNIRPIFDNPQFYKYAFAACLSLLLLSVFAVFVLFTRLQDSNQQLAILEGRNQTITNQVNFINTQLLENEKVLSIIRNPEVQLIKLEGTVKAPLSNMIVAFNSVKEEVMIDMSAMNMPANDQEHQYQLWAMVDGKPIDLGVFDMKRDSTGMKKMKSIGQAQLFAITLEPRGGSVNPTMEQMMAMGNI